MMTNLLLIICYSPENFSTPFAESLVLYVNLYVAICVFNAIISHFNGLEVCRAVIFSLKFDTPLFVRI